MFKYYKMFIDSIPLTQTFQPQSYDLKKQTNHINFDEKKKKINKKFLF